MFLLRSWLAGIVFTASCTLVLGSLVHLSLGIVLLIEAGKSGTLSPSGIAIAAAAMLVLFAWRVHRGVREIRYTSSWGSGGPKPPLP